MKVFNAVLEIIFSTYCSPQHKLTCYHSLSIDHTIAHLYIMSSSNNNNNHHHYQNKNNNNKQKSSQKFPSFQEARQAALNGSRLAKVPQSQRLAAVTHSRQITFQTIVHKLKQYHSTHQNNMGVTYCAKYFHNILNSDVVLSGYTYNPTNCDVCEMLTFER
jgi:hypothetical protein